MTRQGEWLQIEESMFRLDMSKKISTVMVMTHWNRLLREAVDGPTLESFKMRLDGALRNLF